MSQLFYVKKIVDLLKSTIFFTVRPCELSRHRILRRTRRKSVNVTHRAPGDTEEEAGEPGARPGASAGAHSYLTQCIYQ